MKERCALGPSNGSLSWHITPKRRRKQRT